MKKTVIAALLIAVTALSQNTKAQGLLGKLKDKVGQSGGSKNEPSKSQIKAAEEDSADVFLDGKTLTKDEKGISGIYFSRNVVTGQNDDMTGNKFIKKFLVTYNDAEALLTINSRYSYEAKDRTKFIKPATFGYRGGIKSREHAICKTIGKLYYDEGSNDNQYLMHTTYNSTEDLQGSIIRNDEGYIEKWSDVAIMEYTPGILLIYNNVFSGSSVREDPKALEKNKFKKATILFKKEKMADAYKITDEMVAKAFLDFSTKYAKGEVEYSKKTMTLKPEYTAAFKDKPTKAQLEASVKEYMSKGNWEESFLTVYATGAWTNRNELLGVLAQNTLTYRTLLCVVVVKKSNGDCVYYDWSIKQQNLYTTGSLEEKFSGQPLIFNGLTPWGEIDCAKVKVK